MLLRLATLLVLAVPLGACDALLPDPPKQCDPAGVVAGEPGCLSDEICIDFKCLPRPRCESDEDCPTSAFECVLPAQICELREGFGQECNEPEAPCEPSEFCALGLCRPRSNPPTVSCSNSFECPTGQRCDVDHAFCIPDAPCTLIEDFPEVECDFGQTCDALSGRCLLECQEQCTPGAQPDVTAAECGSDVLRCDGACRCVECIANEDCGPGLVCESRSGVCVNEDRCFSDEDCIDPLICDPVSGLCQVAPPACLDDFDCAIAEVCDVATGRCVEPEGPCAGDRLEESDTPANAEELDLAPGEADLIPDLTLCPDDDDVFSIVLEPGDRLTAIIQHEDLVGSSRATMWLYDSSAETALRFTQAPPFGSGRIIYVAQEAGVVYLRVNALSGQTPYDLFVERDSGTPCQADFFEGAGGNDDVATATDGVPLLGVGLSGTVCPGDQDVFSVTVAAGEALSASLAFDPTQADLDVAFLDPSGAVLAQDAGADAPELLRRRFSFPQTVFVRVRGFGTDTGSYTLTLDREAPFVCTADAAEPDDDVIEATAVPLNQGLASESRTMCAGDEDFLLVPLEDFERVIVRGTYVDSDVELTIDVLDETGTDVRASSPPATGGAAVSYDAVGDETVLVRIRGAGGAIGAYTLVVTKENQLTCTPDAAEPNNTVGVASPLPAPSELLSICESDQDFFAIEGVADKKLVIDASFRQADGDIDLMLLGLDGIQILEVADGQDDGEHLEVVLPLDGVYTLRVFSLTSGARAPYSLATQLVTP